MTTTQISLAEVLRRMTVGTRWRANVIGSPASKINGILREIVKSNRYSIVFKVLEGPNSGNTSTLQFSSKEAKDIYTAEGNKITVNSPAYQIIIEYEQVT